MTFDEAHEKQVKALQDLIDSLNTSASDDKAIELLSNTLQREHRTLQASFWRVVKGLADNYSKASFDARNEGAVKLCQKIASIEEYIPFI
jgi:hypothetical protein